MKKFKIGGILCCLLWMSALLFATNPVISDPNADLADPEVAVFNGRFYIYPTYVPSKDWASKYFKAYSSADLITWRDEGQILSVNDVSWGSNNSWAPCIIQRGSTYYYYFCMNQQIGVATSSSPTGPFKDALGHPLVTTGAYGGQSIDPDVFIDDDGQAYLYFGQGVCNVVRLNANMIQFDGSVQKITPSGYNEGAYMIKRNGIYYLMWSENDTRSIDYRVAYATASSPLGPFTKQGIILSRSGDFNGPGHHSVFNNPGTDDWYIVYHRHYVPGGGGQFREICIDRMYFNSNGTIQPVIPTNQGITTPVTPGQAQPTPTPPVPGSYSGYLLSYFTGSEETLHYAYSLDALQWYTLNNGATIISSTIGNRSMRDPCVVRGQDNVFHLMATNSWSSREIVVFDSPDLINWSGQRLVTIAPSGNTFAWAPECTWDPAIGQYRIYFASDLNSIHKMYSVTTSDFRSVSSPSPFYDPGSGLYAIDGTIIPYNGTQYMFFKYSDPGPAGKGIQRVQSASLAGPWSNRSGALTDNTVEGPTAFKDNNADKWYLYYDYYTAGYWGCSTTTNPAGSWTQLASSTISLPAGVRHGNIISVTADELNGLINKFGSTGPRPSTPPIPGNINHALNKPVTASSVQSANPIASGNDGSAGTRWCASDGTVPQWWQVDLGAPYNLTQVAVTWELSGRVYNYLVEVSANATSWTTVLDKRSNTSTAQTQINTITAAAARYVRITVTGLAASTWASFYEFEVYGGQTATPSPTPSPTPTPTASPTPSLTPTPGYRGDVNSDGSIDIVDALMIAQYSVGLQLASFNTAVADVNCNGSIDIVDALITAQYYVGLLTSLNC